MSKWPERTGIERLASQGLRSQPRRHIPHDEILLVEPRLHMASCLLLAVEIQDLNCDLLASAGVKLNRAKSLQFVLDMRLPCLQPRAALLERLQHRAYLVCALGCFLCLSLCDRHS